MILMISAPQSCAIEATASHYAPVLVIAASVDNIVRQREAALWFANEYADHWAKSERRL